MALAFFSPISTAESDAAITLLAAQAVVDHHTLSLDAYVDHPDCAYDLRNDYRVRKRDGSYYYFIVGGPVLSVPMVWIANRFGYHMLDQGDEFATQNAISALICGIVFLLLYRTSRFFLPPWTSLVISLVTMLGSSLISTLATGLWNQGYATLGMQLVVLELVRSEKEQRPLRWPILLALVVGSFLCRPTAAFLFIGLVAFFVAKGVLALRAKQAAAGGQLIQPRHLVWLLALTVTALVLSRFLLEIEWLSNYYSPRRLFPPRTPLSEGVYGNLLSPSRGLYIFSPFLLPITLACAWRWRSLSRQPLFWLAAAWGASHLLGDSIKGVWWGGHSFGPRLLAEMILPGLIATLLVWPRSDARTGHWLRTSFLALGAISVAINSYQGLFNPATKRWNFVPDIDTHTEYIFSWRYPQFLATPRMLDERYVEIQRKTLEPYAFGDTIEPSSERAVFDGWWEVESAWRWSNQTDPAIHFRLPSDVTLPRHVQLDLICGALDTQQVALELNGERLGEQTWDGFEPHLLRLSFPGRLLVAGAENTLRLDVPGARAVSEDRRILGLAFRSMRLLPIADLTDGLSFRDDRFFGDGFSAAEAAWRWTAEKRAVLFYPLDTVDRQATYELTLRGGTLGNQRLEVRIDDTVIGGFTLDGFAARDYTLSIDGAMLQEGLNRLELSLPDAYAPAGDARQLGLALVALRLTHGAQELG